MFFSTNPTASTSSTFDDLAIRDTRFDIYENRDEGTLSIGCTMNPEGTLPEVVPKSVLNQTDISTGIGPTGTDTPAPKDIMPKADHLEHSIDEPLSRPPGALFQVGSGSKADMNEKVPEPISEEKPATNGTVAKSPGT